MKNNISYEEQIELTIIGARLKAVREAFGLTLTELCKLSKIDSNSYIKVERGERNVTVNILFNISEGIGIPITKIFNEEYCALRKNIEDEKRLDKMITEDFCRMVNRKKVISMLKNYRKRKNMSQYVFSLKTGISRDIINNFEYGRAKITPELLKSLMEEMGLKLEELLEKIDYQ